MWTIKYWVNASLTLYATLFLWLASEPLFTSSRICCPSVGSTWRMWSLRDYQASRGHLNGVPANDLGRNSVKSFSQIYTKMNSRWINDLYVGGGKCVK